MNTSSSQFDTVMAAMLGFCARTLEGQCQWMRKDDITRVGSGCIKGPKGDDHNMAFVLIAGADACREIYNGESVLSHLQR